MNEDPAFDGLPQARPRKLFIAIVVMAFLFYIPLVLTAYVFQDESRKQLAAEGMALLNTQDYTGAVAVWQRLLAQHPDAVEAFLGLGIAYTQMGDFERADDAFVRGLELYSGDNRLVFNRALSFMSRGDRAKARELLLDLRGRDALYPETHYHLGRMAEAEGDFKTARDLYVQELNVNAACAKAWYRLDLLQAGGQCPR
ncbi:MAG: tetratricopeptide repeat protein [Planctomycetota bacterium]